MKKSFKKSIAVLLAVLMVICALPISALADETKPNISLVFGSFYNVRSGNYTMKNISGSRGNTDGFANSGLKSATLDYNSASGTLSLDPTKATPTYTDYQMTGTKDLTFGTGDYITVSVVLNDVSSVAAAQAKINYTNLVPVGVAKKSSTVEVYSGAPSTGYTLQAEYTCGLPIAAQSFNALYNSSTTVGELSYIDMDTNTMCVNVAAQDRQNSVSTTGISADLGFRKEDGTAGNTYANKAILATFAFKIVDGSQPITFDIADENSVDDAYYLATTANGGSESEYITYATTSDEGSNGLTFMGENEFDGSAKYTVQFVNGATNAVISSTKYNAGATINVPALPTKNPDSQYHYSYAWNTTPAATATADVTYTAIETATAHTLTSAVTVEPTTTSTGVKTYSCQFCSYSYTETLPMIEEPSCDHAHTTTTEQIVTNATCQQEGSKIVTVTCDDCHEVLSSQTVAISKTAHSYGAYTYNGDAQYNQDTRVGVDGTMSATCSVCGHVDTKTATGTGLLANTTFTLSLESSLVIAFRALKSNFASNIDNVSVVITRGTKTLEMAQADFGTYRNSKGVEYWEVPFNQMPPQTMNDTVTCVYHGTIDGVEVWGAPYTTSVFTYAKKMIDTYYTSSNATYRKLTTLLVDLLNYGAAAQTYGKYNTANLVNSQLTAEQLAKGTATTPTATNIKNTTYSVLQGGKVTWANGTLTLSEAVIPKFKFLIKDSSVSVNDVTVNIRVGTKATYSYSYAERPDLFELQKDGGYYFSFPGLNANNMSEVLYATVSVGGTVISDTMTYSAESYVASIPDSSAYKTLKDLAVAMLKYGNAAKAYAS